MNFKDTKAGTAGATHALSSLAAKISLGAGLLIMIAVGLVASHAIHASGESVHDAFEAEAVVATELLADGLAWRLDADTQAHAVERLAEFQAAHSREIVWIALLDEGGEVAWRTPGAPPLDAEAERFLAKAHASTGHIASDDAHLQGAPLVLAKDGDRSRLGAVVVLWSEDALLAKIDAEMWALAGIGALIACAAAGLMAFFLSRAVARPIRSVADSLAALSEGRQVDIAGRDRRDEIGQLVRSLDSVIEGAKRARRIEAAVQASSSPLMLSDAEGRITYVNKAFADTLDQSRRYFESAHPNDAVWRLGRPEHGPFP